MFMYCHDDRVNATGVHSVRVSTAEQAAVNVCTKPGSKPGAYSDGGGYRYLYPQNQPK